MISENLIELVKRAGEPIDNLTKGVVVIDGYGFAFINSIDLSKVINLDYTAGLCNFGVVHDLLEALENDELEESDFETGYYKIDDLLYLGSIKTLMPSIGFGGVEHFFEVGIIIKTPYKKIFPAFLCWGKGGLTIGGWKRDLLGKFMGIKKSKDTIELTPIEFSNDEIDELVEALQLSLQKIPVSDFEGDYWTELGGIRIGIESGIPFIKDIPFEEDVDYALCYYEGEFWDILERNHSSKDWDLFTEKLDNVDSEEGKKMFDDYQRDCIKKCYNELLNYVKKQNSRYAFQSIGIFLMEHGARMTDGLKKLILKNSHWNDERNNYKDKRKRKERKDYLFLLRAKILDYKEGNITLID